MNKSLIVALGISLLVASTNACGSLVDLKKSIDDEDWYLDGTCPDLEDADELLDLCESSATDKHIFVEFYLPSCYYCYMFSDTWEELYEYFTENYSDQILMYRADGSEQDRLCHKYSVSYFPYVIYIYPESECLLYTAYVGDRTYDLVKEWMLESASEHGLVLTDDDAATVEAALAAEE